MRDVVQERLVASWRPVPVLSDAPPERLISMKRLVSGMDVNERAMSPCT
jgi:hypothetical protein